MSQLNKGKERSFKIIAIVLGFAIIFVIGEITIRVLDLPPKPLQPLYIPKYMLVDNPIIKFKYLSNYVPDPDDESIEDFNKAWYTNSDGFRDREYSLKKDDNTIRIAVLGDSTTAGNLIKYDEDLYTTKLEKLLNKSFPSRNFEVINMGVGGFETFQEVEFLREYGLKYKPDYVLLGMCLNDFDVDSDGGVYQALMKLNNHLRVPSLLSKILQKSRLAFFTFYRIRTMLPSIGLYHEYKNKILNGRTTVNAGFELLNDLKEKEGFKVFAFIIPNFEKLFTEYRYDYIHDNFKKEISSYPDLGMVDFKNGFAAMSNDSRIFSDDGIHANVYGQDVLANLLFAQLNQQWFSSFQEYQKDDFKKGAP